ncbi:uncharacterized protein Tco025E_00462 [Trypanosoma conorhini]|uniref:Uncharacterized protein n=1 Tax=Trypanosoma conorhini TaxID=83891 RepID=A0A422QBC4_9TRYP|nr:uncharacterized protein Tco025E_00462 [Trypanosoma conorhini]RNF27271.1 hypothetical protein Tco025E_00462 [Trypanosoma conorhini]
MAETGEAQPNELKAAAIPVDGLTFVDEAKLHSDFRRLKGNQMYFVDHCVFYERNGGRGERRIFALTPTAFFVLDHHGAMERASPYDLIAAIYQKKTKDKRALFSAAEHHLLLKIPSEIDCHVSFGNPAVLQKCVHVFVTLLQAQRGTAVSVKEVPAEKEIEFFCSELRPEGYYTPREVAEINRQRSHFATYIREGRAQVTGLLSEIEAAKAQIAAHEEEVEDLKRKGIDETSIRTRKANLEGQQVRLHRQMSHKHDECERVLDSVKVLQERLAAARDNTEGLVEKGLAERRAEVNKKHEEAADLRRAAHQKEKNALVGTIAVDKKELHAVWAGATDAKRRGLVAQVEASLVALEREDESAYRLQKFLATINGELQLHSDQISALNLEKQNVLNEREKKTVGPSQAAAAAAVEGDPLDDPLLGLSASPTNAVAAAFEDPLATPPAEEDLL